VPRVASQTIKLLVFIKSGRLPIVVDLRYSGLGTAASPVVQGSGSGEMGWNSGRYIAAVRYHLLGERVDLPPRRVPSGLRLVHDRDPAHTSSAFTDFASQLGITVVTLPAKAADLDPLDYGVFGTVKRAWERQGEEGQLDWDAQCQLAIRMLEAFDPAACIAALPHRMQQCIAAQGWHFED